MIYEFAATQDLHGYDKPWAPGTNKNKFNPDDMPTPGNLVQYKSFYVGDGDFIASTDCPYVAGNAAVFFLAGEVSSGASTLTNGVSSRTGRIQTAIDGYVTVAWRLYSNINPQNYKIQIESGTTITSWVPYANVCMPEGFNIWDPTNQEYIQVYAGYVNANTRELYLRPVYDEYAGEELVGPWMSSFDPYEEDTTPTEGAFVIDFGGELESFEITPFMLQTLLDSLGIRQHFTDGAGLLNKLMDQAQGRVRSEEELLHLSRPLNVIAIGDQLPAGITFKPISKDVLPGLPGKFIR